MAMDEDLRRHLGEMLSRLRPPVEMAERGRVPGRAAARLRAAAAEVEDALDAGGAGRRGAAEREAGRENMDLIARREREGAAWGIDEA
jgi:hypothetical protein